MTIPNPKSFRLKEQAKAYADKKNSTARKYHYFVVKISPTKYVVKVIGKRKGDN